MQEYESYLTNKDIAKILNVHPRTITRLIRSGELKGIQVGDLWRVRPSDFDAYIKKQEEIAQQNQ